MKFEHFAINVAEPQAMTAWYVEHLGLRVVRQLQESPFTTFLADSSGTVMLEIYGHPAAAVLDFKNMHPLQVHLAFVSDNPATDLERLVGAGAKMVSEQHLEDGSHLVMLRDPWGFSIQLCKRGTPMLPFKVTA